MYLDDFYDYRVYILVGGGILFLIGFVLYFLVGPRFSRYKNAKIYIAGACFSFPIIVMLTFFSNRGILELFGLDGERFLFILLSFFAFGVGNYGLCDYLSREKGDFFDDVGKASIFIPMGLFLLQMPIHP